MNRGRRTQAGGGGGEGQRAGERSREERRPQRACQGVSGGSSTAIDGRRLYREVYAVLQIFDRADVHAA